MPVKVEIISPEKVLVSREVEMAVVPGMEGDIAAMPGRAPLMLILRGGVVDLYEGGKVADRFFVGGGFADMNGDLCTVLADNAIPLSELSAEAATTRLAELDAAWNEADKDDVPALDVLMEKMQTARAEIEAAGGTV